MCFLKKKGHISYVLNEDNILTLLQFYGSIYGILVLNKKNYVQFVLFCVRMY